jgi:oligopeptide/dipeptide ABC transporter ATP-binding protein
VFRRETGTVKAVDGIDLDIYRGECLGVVGESGCGKTTIGKAIIRLHDPSGGHVYYFANGSKSTTPLDVGRTNKSTLKKLGIRAKLQMVFQDPSTSLNPRMLVKNIIAEPIKNHARMGGRELENRVIDLLQLVGLTRHHLLRYPHEFSGGQRQRIAVARAIATNPEFIVLDEPTSALDVSVQAQVLNLLLELQGRLDLTYLFISHDLSVIRYTCDWVALMYLGRIVELAPVEVIFDAPLHPYTRALRSAMPEPDPDYQGEEIILEGEISTRAEWSRGCRFAPRCPAAKINRCYEEEPQLLDVGGGHLVACHLHHTI